MLYRAILIVLRAGGYDPEIMQQRLDNYLLRGLITQEQYSELQTMI